MGGVLKRVIAQETDALSRLQEWGGLSPDDMHTLLSWTGEPIGDVRIRFRNEVFLSCALRNPVVRGCPVCLRQDADFHDGDPLEAMVMRGDWQLREVIICLQHNRPLVPLWRADRVDKRQDIGARLLEISDVLLRGDLDPPELEASAFDHWLDIRIQTGGDNTCLADTSLYAATTMCRLLGHTILGHGLEFISDVRMLRDAQASGFAVLRQGKVATRAALHKAASKAEGTNDGLQKAFGHLFIKLSRAYISEDAFSPFRSLLRACILDYWPIAARSVLLGEEVPQRRLHSLASAAAEIRVGAAVLDKFLTEAGAFSVNDQRPFARKTFNATQFAGLIAEIPTLVGPIEMCKSMGATLHELKSLRLEGILSPRTEVPKIKSPWRIADGQAVVARLSSLAENISAVDANWETIQAASRRASVPKKQIIDAIERGQLRDGVGGYHGFEVHSAEFMIWPRHLLKDALPPEAQIAGVISAAAFARSIGLRDQSSLANLMAEGHATGFTTLNPKMRRLQWQMSEADIAAFHEKFLTLATMQTEFKLHRNTLRGLLSAAGCTRFSPSQADFGPIWLRKAVEPILRQNRRS